MATSILLLVYLFCLGSAAQPGPEKPGGVGGAAGCAPLLVSLLLDFAPLAPPRPASCAVRCACIRCALPSGADAEMAAGCGAPVGVRADRIRALSHPPFLSAVLSGCAARSPAAAMPLYEIMCITTTSATPQQLVHMLQRLAVVVQKGKGVFRRVEHLGVRPLAHRMKAHMKYNEAGRSEQHSNAHSAQTQRGTCCAHRARAHFASPRSRSLCFALLCAALARSATFVCSSKPLPFCAKTSRRVCASTTTSSRL